MFPYLRKISDFIKDCETVRNEISLKKSGEHQFVTLYNPRKSDKHFTCNQKCESCKNMPAIVTQLIRNVDEANWGGDASNGINSVAYSEIRAWCQSICVALYEVLKPLENMDLVIGFEYYLETRKGFGRDKKNHYRVDVMIGGYGSRFGKPEGRLLVMEQKQYEVVHWKKSGRELTWFYNNTKKTVESPCYQVKFYCDNISESLDKSSLNPYSVYPCVFMHNLKKENILVGPYDELDLDSADGVVLDNGVLYQGRPVEIFIKGEDEHDNYRALRDRISEVFDYSGTDQKAITVFRELKKGYQKFTQEDLGDILVCEDDDIESRFKSILRPDQFFAMYGYGEDNHGLDNYLKNHIDYFSFFRDQENREYWGPAKHGVIDVIEGGPGSGKTVLAMLILRYCLSRGMSVLYTFSGTAPVNRIFGYLAELLSEQTQTDTGGKRKTFVESINSIPSSALKKFEIFRSYKDKRRFDIVGLSDVPKNPDYDVYIIDDAHIDKERYVKSRPGEKNANIIRDLEKKKKLVFMLYDRHQIIDEPIKGSDGSKENEYFTLIEEIAAENPGGKAFRNRNSFRLWSMFRCNSNEGYLTWVEKVLGIISYDKKKDFELFDFDVRVVDDTGIKKLASAIREDDDILVMSEAIGHEELTRVLGRNAVIYSGENGMMKPLDESGAINVGRAIKIRGVEAEKAIVIIDDRIRFEDGKVVGDTNLKNKYRILLTRGLKECYIYVVDNVLREFMIKSLT
jgi:hypothetical protein